MVGDKIFIPMVAIMKVHSLKEFLMVQVDS